MKGNIIRGFSTGTDLFDSNWFALLRGVFGFALAIGGMALPFVAAGVIRVL
jgi:hypothetical protein